MIRDATSVALALARRLHLEIPSGASQIAGMPERHGARSDCVLIKRYAGRRLYNTASSVYVTREDLADMILAASASSPATRKRAPTSPATCSTGCTETQISHNWGVDP
jgi:hypothetical protein